MCMSREWRESEFHQQPAAKETQQTLQPKSPHSGRGRPCELSRTKAFLPLSTDLSPGAESFRAALIQTRGEKRNQEASRLTASVTHLLNLLSTSHSSSLLLTAPLCAQTHTHTMWTKAGLLWTFLLLGFHFQSIPANDPNEESPQISTVKTEEDNKSTAPTTRVPTTASIGLATTKATTKAATTVATTAAGATTVTTQPPTILTTAQVTTKTSPTSVTVGTSTAVPTSAKTTPNEAPTQPKATQASKLGDEDIKTTTTITLASTKQTTSQAPDGDEKNVNEHKSDHKTKATQSSVTSAAVTTTLQTSPKNAAVSTSPTVPASPETTPTEDITQSLLGATQRTDVPESQTEPEANPVTVEITEDELQNSTNNDPIVQTCRKLLQQINTNGGCIMNATEINGNLYINNAVLTISASTVQKIYDDLKNVNSEDTPVPKTMIAILSSCGALMLILVLFALYCMCHHRSYRKNQQHLTEELQTVENGYHDNPTLDVMEVQPEMQEKKPTLNGEFNDSWIVPIDNLVKEDMPDEEDTHL